MPIEIPPPPGKNTFLGRQEKLRRALRQIGCNGAFVTPGPTFCYLTGCYLTGEERSRSDRLQAIVVPGAGGVIWVVAAFEARSLAPPPGTTSTIAWQEEEDPFEALADMLRRSGCDGPLALEPTTYLWVVEALRERLGNDALISGARLFDSLRLLKEPAEIDLLRVAQRLTAEVIEEAFERMQPGMTDIEVQRWIEQAYAERDLGGWALVQIDQASANPHDLPSGRLVREDSVVLIDSGAVVHGYHGDMTRTVRLGKPSDDFAAIHRIVQEAHDQAITRARPTVQCQELDHTARAVITESGHGAAFLHRLGHGIGLEGHEPPYLVTRNELRLRPGMAMTIEPGIYLEGRFGVRVEDLIVITPEGAEIL